MLERIINWVLARMLGHYTAPYIITETSIGRYGPFTRQLKIMGTLDEVVSVASKRWNHNRKATYIAVLTRGRKVVWQKQR